MTAQFQCPHCDGFFQIEAGFAGGQVACPACQGVVAIPESPIEPPSVSPPGYPSPPESVTPPAAPNELPIQPPAVPQPGHVNQPAALPVSCPFCNGMFQVTTDMAGQAVACPHCQQAVTTPHPQETQVAPPGGYAGGLVTESPLTPPTTQSPEVSIPTVPQSPASHQAPAHQPQSQQAPAQTASRPATQSTPTPSLVQPAASSAADPNMMPPGFESPQTGASSASSSTAPVEPSSAESSEDVEGILPPAAAQPDELLPPGASQTPGQEVALPKEDDAKGVVPALGDDSGSGNSLRRPEPNEKENRKFKKNLILWTFGLIIIAIVGAILTYLGPIQ